MTHTLTSTYNLLPCASNPNIEAGQTAIWNARCHRAVVALTLLLLLALSMPVVGMAWTTWIWPTSGNVSAAIGLTEFDCPGKIPPWMSPIKEGARQGVALVFGQSLNPDASPSQVLVDRAKMAKVLLDQGQVIRVIVSGGDPARVGRTEASEMAKVLEGVGVPKASIIQEPQATSTAENAWFMLRWIPEGTGHLYVVTSDFHMPRATYIIQETHNYFYKMVENQYRNDPRWKSKTKKYPRLKIHQATVKSFCGSDGSLNKDDDSHADINTKSLAWRAMNELGHFGTNIIANRLFGPPEAHEQYIWPIQINVTQDPENNENFQKALAQVMNVAQNFCACKAPPEKVGPQLHYPLTIPIPVIFEPIQGSNTSTLLQVVNKCKNSVHCGYSCP